MKFILVCVIVFLTLSVSFPVAIGQNIRSGAKLSGTSGEMPFRNWGLVGWWRAEYNTEDSAGTNDGKSNDSLSYSPGAVGQAFNFCGERNLVEIANSQRISFSASNEYSIGFWLRTLPHTNQHPAIVEKWNDYTNDGYPYVVRLNTGKYGPEGTITAASFSGGNGGTYAESISRSRVDDDLWHHVVAVYRHSRKEISVFIDGRLDNSLRYSELSTIHNNLPVTLGARKALDDERRSAFEYNGRLDEVMIFSRALSAYEIDAIYRATRPGSSSQPLGQPLASTK